MPSAWIGLYFDRSGSPRRRRDPADGVDGPWPCHYYRHRPLRIL